VEKDSSDEDEIKKSANTKRGKGAFKEGEAINRKEKLQKEVTYALGSQYTDYDKPMKRLFTKRFYAQGRERKKKRLESKGETNMQGHEKRLLDQSGQPWEEKGGTRV